MSLARCGVLAVTFAAMIGSVAPAEQRATTATRQSTKIPGLPRIAYRSFWPQERYNRQFAEAGVKLVFIYPANTICSLNVPYSSYALRLKEPYAGERLWVASYSNSVPAYIPSERVLKEGGYEGATAMVYFGIHGPFRPGVEDRVVGAVRRLMDLCR